MKEERSQRARRRAEATLRSGKFVRGPVQPPRGCHYGGTKMVEGIKTAVLDVTYCPSGSAKELPPPFPQELLFPLENSPGDERSSPPPPAATLVSQSNFSRRKKPPDLPLFRFFLFLTF